jgi:hypothetical protein
MSVLELTPHRLARLETTAGYEDENGDYHKAEGDWSSDIACRAVPAGEAKSVTFDDGVTRSYTYTVYLPANVEAFTLGEEVRLTLDNGSVSTFTVKGFHRYQYKSKLWL